ncbi:hypothetical protein [Chryseobacterium sp. G0201]|uniref:hypothetical protein n=1 Tax=Chryseobacterium sp. G0201 TaxID=2487065 RepID=UPI000F50330A|nr:hypothetical protein [Chryseobacterium sp. G0201]
MIHKSILNLIMMAMVTLLFFPSSEKRISMYHKPLQEKHLPKVSEFVSGIQQQNPGIRFKSGKMVRKSHYQYVNFDKGGMQVFSAGDIVQMINIIVIEEKQALVKQNFPVNIFKLLNKYISAEVSVWFNKSLEEISVSKKNNDARIFKLKLYKMTVGYNTQTGSLIVTIQAH